MAREVKAGRRNVVFIVVILGHSLLIVLFLRPELQMKEQPEENVSSLLLLDLSVARPPTAPVLPPESITKTHEGKKISSPTDRAVIDSATTPDSAAISTLAVPASPLGIDWYQQAQQVVDSQAESIFKELKHICDRGALLGEQRPECRKYKKPDAWVPEPKKLGISGVLPYVRLGKRCILGLGFFGCGVGKLPEPNAHVLDDMREPDRPASSVPDPNE